MKTWRIVTATLLFLALAGSLACNPFGEGGEATSQQLVEAERGDLMVVVSGSGNTEVAEEARLAFGTAGKIERIYVDDGDTVGKGDLLAELDTSALELAVTQAELALKTAEFNLDRMADVAEAKDEITDAEYEVKVAEARLKEALGSEDSYIINYWRNEVILAQAKLLEAQQDLAEILADPDYAGLMIDEVTIKQLQVEAAQQTLEQAQKQLDEATITAPFAGVVVSVDADEGDTVSTAAKFIHLIDLTSMELKVEVDEIDIAEVKPGQRAVIELDALPSLELEGEVSSISLLPKAQAGLITYTVTIAINAPEDSGLKIGMSATADIVINERSNALLVPSRAIKQDSEGNDIVEVMVNEQIEQRSVVTGISDGFQTEIIYGLSKGETVVIEIKAQPSTPALF